MNDIEMKPSQVIVRSIQHTEYNLYLHGEIGSPDDFMEHFAVFKTAGEGDLIRLYINSPGGSLSTGQQLITHMRECQAYIVAVLGVEVASMASAIALEADEVEIDELSTMLVHSLSYRVGGTENSVYTQALFNNKLNERWVKSTYGDFLTETELGDVLKGVDIILDAEQIAERWNARQQSQYGCEHCLDESEEILEYQEGDTKC